MNAKDKEETYLIKGCYASPGLDKPEVFYKTAVFYSNLYLKRGIELWNSNPIKTCIKQFHLECVKIPTPLHSEQLSKGDIEISQECILLSAIKSYIESNRINLDICILLMAIAVERVLKGFLLHDNYVIHKNPKSNLLIKLDPNFKDFSKLNKEIYSLEEFTEYDHILEAALPGEMKRDIVAISMSLKYLRNLRDSIVHFANGNVELRPSDIYLFKIIYFIFLPAFQIFEEVQKELELLNLKTNYINEANDLNEQTKYNEAFECCKKALEIDPLSKEAWINKGNALLGLSRFNESIECYDIAIRIDPSLKVAWNNRGYALSKSGKKEDALCSIDKSLDIDLSYAGAWNNKGTVLNGLGKYRDAIVCLNKAIEIDPSLWEAWGNKGDSLLNLHEYDDSVGCYEKSLELNPKCATILCNKGIALYELCRYDEALNCYDMSIELDSELQIAWIGKGITLDHLERYNEAIECYNRAKDLTRSREPYFMELDLLIAETWYNKGVMLFMHKNYFEAIANYNKSIDINNKYINAWDAKGIALLRLGAFDESLKAFDEVLKLNPSAKVSEKRGLALYSSGKFEDAVDAYKKSIETSPDRISLLISLTGCYGLLGRTKEYTEGCKAIQDTIEKENEYTRACFKAVCNDSESALSLLRIALEKTQVDLNWMNKDPDLQLIRDTQGFKELVRDFSVVKLCDECT